MITVDEVSDERIETLSSRLTDLLQAGQSGFADHMIWRGELQSLLLEVKRYRDRPTHCPDCDGDHL